MAKSDRIIQTFPTLRADCAQNAALQAISPIVVQINRIRRSRTSASAPPQRPKMTSGTSPKTSGESDVRGTPCDGVDLGGDRDNRQLCTDDGDDVGHPQTPKVDVAQGRSIGEQTGHRSSLAVRKTRAESSGCPDYGPGGAWTASASERMDTQVAGRNFSWAGRPSASPVPSTGS